MLSLPHLPGSIAILALSCAVGAASAQGSAPARPDPAALKACSAANRQAVADLSLAVEVASSRNRLNPVTMSRLLSIESNLAALKSGTARDARSQRECDQAGLSIAAENDRLQRIIGPDPEVVECMKRNQQAHGQALQTLAALPEGARVHAQALQLRLADLKPALSREGQSLAECKQYGASIAEERARLAMLEAPPAIAAAPERARALSAPAAGSAPGASGGCRVLHADTYTDLVQKFARALQLSDSTEAARQRLQGIGQRLDAVHTALSRDAPGTDCKAIEQAMAGIAADLNP